MSETMTEAQMQSAMRRESEAEARTLRARVAELEKKQLDTQLALEKAIDGNAEGSWMARALDAERENARLALACSTTGADLTEIGRLCGIRDDEYPLRAVQRVVAALASVEQRVERLEAALKQLAEMPCEIVATFSTEDEPQPSCVEIWPAPRDEARSLCGTCTARELRSALAAGESAGAEPLFYVQDKSRSRDCAVWWRPNGNGYTCDLSRAGLYPAGGQWADDCVLWPREVVERMAVRHVRAEALAASAGREKEPGHE